MLAGAGEGGRGGESNCAAEPFIESRLQRGSMVLKHRALKVPDTHPSRGRGMERDVDRWGVEEGKNRKESILWYVG